MFTELLSQLWFHFLLVALFGFLTGMEVREYLLSKEKEGETPLFPSPGSARTYTYIAILGLVLQVLDPGFRLYLAGMGGLLLLFALYYHRKLQEGGAGILQPLIALAVYAYGPAISLQPPWFLVLLFVTVIFTLNARPFTHRLTEAIDRGELMTLAKFLLLAAVILPLMPDRPVIPFVPTTPFKIWVAVVAISAISYSGYILQRYLFPHQGYLVTGVLGGLYSSTATTMVLSRRLRSRPADAGRISMAIVAASGMMYLRLLLIILVLNRQFLEVTLAPFLLLGLGSMLFAYLRFRRESSSGREQGQPGSHNPLELGTAFLFALLFLVMLLLSQWVLRQFGTPGLQLLSFIVGFTDIDPYVLSLLKGNYHGAPVEQLAAAVVIAAGSNNFLKAFYAAFIGGWRRSRTTVLALVLMGTVTLLYGVALAW